MKKVIFCILFLGILWESFGQLVRRKDYDAAFALQVGGETSALTAFQNAGFLLRPVAGLKMTFPFTRKWFLGGEINYSELKYSFAGPQQTDFHIKQLHVPVYLKYMLNCNKASVLFGLYVMLRTGIVLPDLQILRAIRIYPGIWKPGRRGLLPDLNIGW